MQFLQYYRSEVKLEFDLRHHRVLWLTTGQTLLLTLAGFLFSRSTAVEPWFLRLVATLGIAIGILAFVSIDAALKTITLWKNKKQRLLDGGPAPWQLAAMISRDLDARDDPLHSRSLWFPRLLAPLFILVWGVILSKA